MCAARRPRSWCRWMTVSRPDRKVRSTRGTKYGRTPRTSYLSYFVPSWLSVPRLAVDAVDERPLLVAALVQVFEHHRQVRPRLVVEHLLAEVDVQLHRLLEIDHLLAHPDRQPADAARGGVNLVAVYAGLQPRGGGDSAFAALLHQATAVHLVGGQPVEVSVFRTQNLEPLALGQAAVGVTAAVGQGALTLFHVH